MSPTFDTRDAEILAARTRLLDERPGPRVGDFVVFANSVTRRISYVWPWPEDDMGVQTSAVGGGSFYLGEGYVSFSGSLYRCVPASTLTRTSETRDGDVWFFHHDWAEADNGVHARLPFRVYASSANAPD